MNKKIIISIAVIALAAVGAYYYFYGRAPLSPAGSAELTSDGLTVSVTYNRPSVRGRVIFGTKESGALQPYGEYWRLGANMATEITFSKDILFGGKEVKAGTYRMYAVPGEGQFEFALNSELGKSGSEDPDQSKDVVRVSVPTEKSGTTTEQFTISLSPRAPGIDLQFEWENVRCVIPMTAQ